MCIWQSYPLGSGYVCSSYTWKTLMTWGQTSCASVICLKMQASWKSNIQRWPGGLKRICSNVKVHFLYQWVSKIIVHGKRGAAIALVWWIKKYGLTNYEISENTGGLCTRCKMESMEWGGAAPFSKHLACKEDRLRSNTMWQCRAATRRNKERNPKVLVSSWVCPLAQLYITWCIAEWTNSLSSLFLSRV
jgi:hypothetical protein